MMRCLYLSPTSNITTIWTPTFEWYVVRCEAYKTLKTHDAFKRGWTLCSNYTHNYRLKSEHDWGIYMINQ